MRLTRRRRRKIYRVVGIIAIILFLIGLIIVNPFQYIHIEFKPKKESTVLKEDDKTKDKEKSETEKKLEEEEKKKAEEEAKKKEEEEKKKKEQEEKEKETEKDKKGVYYTVTFFNKDGSVIYSTSFKQGTTPYYNGTTPTYYDNVYYYEFVGWDKAFKAIYSNTSYIAQYKISGWVPHPTPQPDPDPQDEPEEPEEPENPDEIVEDLSSYNLLYVKNIGDKKGKVQLLRGVGDYSKFGEPLSDLSAVDIHLQYSFDKINWHKFEAYSEFDICAMILNVEYPEVISKYNIPNPEYKEAKNPIVLEPGKTVYFRVPSGYDNPGFSTAVELLVNEEYDQHYTMPCVTSFDIKGYTNPDDTKFEIGGDLTSIIEDSFVKNGKDNKKQLTGCDVLGYAGLFANLSNELFYEITNTEGIPVFNLNTNNNTTSAKTLLLPNLENVSYGNYAYMFSDSNSLKDLPVLDNDVLGEFCYMGMFSSCDGIEEISFIFDDAELVDGCFENMFSNCSKLETFAEGMLPATDLAYYCYSEMFKGTAIHSLPELPAETLAEGCYHHMFENCTQLSQELNLIDYLPATTLADSCYRGMFMKSSIKNLPDLPASTLAESCYAQMYERCEKIQQVSKNYLPATTLAPYCYESMFKYTKITSVPDLPAETVCECSYMEMFCGSSYFSIGPTIKATKFNYPEEHTGLSFYGMFDGCTSLSSFTLVFSELNDYSKVDNFEGLLEGTNFLTPAGKKTIHMQTSPTYEEINHFIEKAGSSTTYWEIVTSKKSPLRAFLNFFSGLNY